MSTTDALEQGRAAMHRLAWNEAFACLSAADRATPLGPEDLVRLATAAHLLGRDADSAELWARAHHAFLRGGDTEGAVRCAFWLAIGLFDAGEPARAGGWIARARRLLEDCAPDCVERGYLHLPTALERLGAGDAVGAHHAFAEAAETGARCGDRDLVALARHGQGRALIRQGRIVEGVALLDEAMVAVTAGELSPMVAGDIYCSVLSACEEIFDLRRAQEWTAALARWCAAQPDLVPYRGQCLVHHAELLLLRGAWSEAMREARRACEEGGSALARPSVGAAYYEQGELHRLRGALADAEVAYREADRFGRTPQPGLALLRLAQGRVAAAVAAVRRVLEETRERRARSRMLPAGVEVLLAAGDLPAARAAAEELAEIAEGIGAPYLRAVSAGATGAVRLAAGDARGALAALRRAMAAWQELETPYETARTRVLVGSACRALGDDDAAAMEFDAACGVFRDLGAAPDLARAERLARPARARATDGLTARELQVLRLIAAGRTNRAIAAALAISEKTVARHVSNILTKLALPSRAAATAYACRHGLA